LPIHFQRTAFSVLLSAQICERLLQSLLLTGPRNLQIVTDLSSQEFVYLSMSWNGRRLARLTINVDRVFAAFAKKLAAEPFEVAD
jgi:hypothetical protein